MTAGEAIAWIASRDSGFADQMKNGDLESISIYLTERNPGFGPVFEAGAAAERLQLQCVSGLVSATGFPGDDRGTDLTRRQTITALDWIDLEIDGHMDLIVAKPKRFSAATTWWHGLAFDKAELLQAFPPPVEGIHSRDLPSGVQSHGQADAGRGYSTGAPGRPSSMHLVEAEFRQRVASGRVEGTLAEQARSLLNWFREVRRSNPDLPPLTFKTITNRLRDQYRAAKAT